MASSKVDGGNGCLERVHETLTDSQKMGFIVYASGVAATVCHIAGESVDAKVPSWLAIAFTPFYFMCAAESAYSNAKMMKGAEKTSDRAFWFMKSVDAMRGFVATYAKVPAECVKVTRVIERKANVAFTFNKILPVTMIVCGVLGFFTKSWALKRTVGKRASAADELKKLQDGLLSDFEQKQLFKTLFTNTKRGEAVLKDRTLLQSEMDRKVLYLSIDIILAGISVSAGILLYHGRYKFTGHVLVLSYSGVAMAKIIFDKTVSQKRFKQMDEFIRRIK